MCYKTACHPNSGRRHHRRHSRRWMKNRFATNLGYPPVNVEELDNRYEILVYAAGYSKGDFQINLKDNILIISVEKPEKERTRGFDWRQLEFQPGSFEKRFELNDKIDKEAISAKYENGILKVALPKLPGTETIRKEIDVK